MRITGGRARSILIKSLPLKDIRPATDFSRERLFAYLENDLIEGARVLDLFAGFGSYGLEALSRGATSAYFIDYKPEALACIEDTHKRLSRSLGTTPPITRLRQNLETWTPTPQAFDLIFADPPYETAPEVLKTLFQKIPLALTPSERARFILELPGHTSPPEIPGLTVLRHFESKKTYSPSLVVYGVPPAGRDTSPHP